MKLLPHTGKIQKSLQKVENPILYFWMLVDFCQSLTLSQVYVTPTDIILILIFATQISTHFVVLFRSQRLITTNLKLSLKRLNAMSDSCHIWIV